MGAYLTLPVGTEIHDQPDWEISGGYIDQDNNRVSISCITNDSGASFRYFGMWVQIVRHFTDGHEDYTEVAGVHGSGENIYKNFSGTISVDLGNESVQYVYLAMRCTNWDNSGHSSHCTISSDADSDPGYKIPGTTLYLEHTVAPVIGNIRNTNPYNSNNRISASTNSISIAVSRTDGDAATAWYYSINNGSWTKCNSSFTISNLSQGTSYTVRVRAQNSAGYSNTVNITIRTRYNAPTVSASIQNIGLEGFNIKWRSNRTMKSIRYKIDNVRNWVSSNVNGTSGTISVSNLSPATKYTVRVSGYSSNTYDSILSNEVTLTVTTLYIAKITSITAITHGEEFTVNITNPSNSNCTLEMWVEGNGDTTTITKTTKATITVEPTESEWDSIYRRYPAANTVTLHAQLTTHGIKDYDDTEKTQTITLTGIQKTAHFGVNNAPRRVQVWVGDSTGKPRRAVCWVGAGGGTKRTI